MNLEVNEFHINVFDYCVVLNFLEVVYSWVVGSSSEVNATGPNA
jgi:hypothetical protein